MSSPKLVVSWPMRLSSNAPSFKSSIASARSAGDGLRSHLAADRRDRAEGAVLVAALGDAEIGVVTGREAETGGVGFEVALVLRVVDAALSLGDRGIAGNA